MRLPDWITGGVLFVLALLVLWHVQSFPEIPGQPYGAALFPGIAAAVLAAASLVLIAGSLRRRARDTVRHESGDGSPIPAPDAAATAPADDASKLTGRRLAALVLSVAAIAFYAFFAQTLGFILTGIIVLAALMSAFGARPVVIVPAALAATLLIHTAFYKLLKVPLPWGILQPLAW